MNKYGFLTLLGLLVLPGALAFPDTGPAPAQTPAPDQAAIEETHKTAYQRRKEAKERLQALQQGRAPQQATNAPPTAPTVPTAPTPTGINPAVDITLPNFANSPNLRKFVDSLPGLTAAHANNLGQYVPVAIPDTTTYPDSDYYEINLVEYSEKMHSDLPPTRLRGYVQVNTTDPTVSVPHYLGPVIVAKKDRPVRVKFTNKLPTGTGGDLFLPVDTTIMGAGMGPLGMMPPVGGMNYTQNRGTLHLHGGLTPWISDGTPHQWVTPANEITSYPKGVSVQNVPDMPDPGPGAITFFYTNQQSARLMFYHDHAYGITRLNVYAGEAAGYLITDQVEEDLIAGTNVSGGNPAGVPILPDLGGVYHNGIPLVIQDKTFVNDATTPPHASFAATGATPTPHTAAVDPLWYRYVPGSTGGNLWLPHEYLPNENIYDNAKGYNDMGRWDYGPWILPPMLVLDNTLPSPSIVPEAFMDTAIVNGTAFPYLELPPTAVRFRILNACNDRMLNLQLYRAEPLSVRVTKGGTGYTAPIVAFSAPTAGVTATGTATVTQGVNSVFTITNPGTGYTTAPTVAFTNAPGDTTGSGAAATATLGAGGVVAGITLTNPGSGYTLAPIVTLSPPPSGTTATATAALTGIVAGITVTNPGSGYTSAPTITITDATGTGAAAIASINTEVKMVEACPNPAFPTWPKDGRDGGVPDPTTMGPDIIQIGNECGFLAKVAVIPAQPVDYDYNRRSVTFGGVTSKALYLPPAVRADVIVDLSSYVDGDTLILYNDAPAPMPLYDTRYDYFTDDPDQTAIGGAPSTPIGFGPNTRTILQIRIKGAAVPSTFNLSALQAALPKAYAKAQEAPLVPESAFNAAYGTTYTDNFANVADYTLNVTGTTQSIAKIMVELPGFGYTTPPTVGIYGGGGTGAAATASLNGVTGITLTAGGTGYTTAPAVTITPAAGDTGTGATAAATVVGGMVTTITITNPGSNYLVAPTVTLTGGGGTGATATAIVTLGSVGAITLTKPGSGYTKAPYVYLAGGGGTGATAAAMLNGSMVLDGKNLVEGMDMMYGRMNAVLGSTPNPLTPTVGAGPVIGAAFYIDPPTEILDAGKTVLWRISHIGVDSHAIHFHLFDVQVINRVDWTNTLKPPYDEEIGWKETIRTNPFEDIIVALRPKAMKLPYGVPDSNRLLDPTMPAGAVGNFQPVPPPVGLPAVAQITNVMTNYGWEYVWHCHLLGHEENDMMRPVVFNVPRTAPTAPTLTAAASPTQVSLTWTDPTPAAAAATWGNPANEVGFRIQRATGTTGGTFTQIATALANATSYIDKTVVTGTTYRYRVVIHNAAGTATSNTVTATAAPPPPAAPTNLAATPVNATRIDLAWTDNANNETGFRIERATNATFTGAGWVTVAANATTYSDTQAVTGTTYYYRVCATNASGNSTWSNSASARATAGPVPAAPSNLAAVVAGAAINLTWTDNANNETGFTIQKATNTSFTGATTITRGANVTTYSDTAVTAGTTYYYRVQATNANGASAWSNTASATVPVPGAPAAPSGLTATVAGANINLAWTDNANNETGFRIERATNASFTGAAWDVAAVNATTFVDTFATVGVTYYYRIRANNAAGNSAWSNTASATR